MKTETRCEFSIYFLPSKRQLNFRIRFMCKMSLYEENKTCVAHVCNGWNLRCIP